MFRDQFNSSCRSEQSVRHESFADTWLGQPNRLTCSRVGASCAVTAVYSSRSVGLTQLLFMVTCIRMALPRLPADYDALMRLILS